MKLNGTYKYFKIVQVFKALFVPLILFTQPAYKSPENSFVVLQFVDLPGKIMLVQKIQPHGVLNNFRVQSLESKKVRIK